LASLQETLVFTLLQIGPPVITVAACLAVWPSSAAAAAALSSVGWETVGALTSSGAVAQPCYLTRESREPVLPFARFEPFTNRFSVIDDHRLRDNLLKVTWLDFSEHGDSGTLLRMDWGAAQKLATKLGARLPLINELKTLITRDRDREGAAFIPSRFFRLSQRTKRCWSADPAGFLSPFHRCFVDFATPAWGQTTMSESYGVLLIEGP
jgi:hypothetical protein